MQVQILPEDDYMTMAEKIYKRFEIGMSCSIYGFVQIPSEMRVIPKGQLVIDEISRLDILDNTDIGSDKRRRRKRVKPPHTIGGYVAHKMFRYEILNTDKGPKVNIWRMQ